MAKEDSICLVGNELIDSHNQDLLVQLKFYAKELVNEQDLQKRYAITSLVANRVLTHFAEEEARMRLRGYPWLLPHQDDHILYTSVIVELFKKIRDTYHIDNGGGPSPVPITVKKMLSCLVKHLSYHASLYDADYARYVTTDRAPP